MGYGGGQNEALELRLGRGVENEVPPSRNRHDPDDKTGTSYPPFFPGLFARWSNIIQVTFNQPHASHTGKR
ncbi:hypothetical protein [Nitrospira sp.]|uniref:hypothetical protein n=1 Tax=Nitrospira sp. TaxID=70125 RepID=UPI003FCCBD91